MSAAAAAVGTFDGVHRGHIAVLDTLKELASEKGLEPMAFTFDRHPLSLIAPSRAPKAITTLHKKEELLRKTQVTPVVMPFDEELRSTTALSWMRILKEKFGVELLVVGYDNTFGCDGVALSISDYRDFGAQLGIEVAEAPVVEGTSSSAIRKAIEAGEVEKANDMLGRRFSLPGIVVEGNRLGRTIGFPTANLLTESGIVGPANGVYAAYATLHDGKRHNAMVNIGVRPTIRRGNDTTVEAHVIDWNGDLYGHNVSVSFVSRLRDEEQFKSIDALRAQLVKDREAAGKACDSRQE